ncbi:MAG: alpha-galactosidase [Lachnospiraceae bacterium]|nr:alpha-galactosidase [Lachnospiraceae bacterium]
MSIQYCEKCMSFFLHTPNTTYIMGIVNGKYLGHIYYGKKIQNQNLRHLMGVKADPFVDNINPGDTGIFYDNFPFEYNFRGIGDFRECALDVHTMQGHHGALCEYRSHRIFKGKPALEKLPATFGSEKNCETLEIELFDPVIDLTLTLSYTVFADNDAICRHVRLHNGGGAALYLDRVLSAHLYLPEASYDMITLHGSWGRERGMCRRPVSYGISRAYSSRGVSSHQAHPFIAVMSPNTTQTSGEVYAMNLVYSGNFIAQTDGLVNDDVIVQIGINPDDFCWKLEPGETFTAPEAVMVYSSQGLGGMTRTFHDLYRSHLIRGKYKDHKRPVLLNNWEATYFDFNTEKLLDIARTASKSGIEMLVMDDGWFGNRFDDHRALGDWVVNEEKLPGGLSYLVSEVNKLNMKFGIWFEPEMVCPDSNLFRAHPDWAIQIPDRENTTLRWQYVLDITRSEVLDYVWASLCKVLKSANIEYVKWDMNRALTNIGSKDLPADRIGEFFHRYTLAVYELQRRLVSEFPDLLLENCSSGGGRFDPGMLYYSPQIWCSDDTDAIERLKIQEGTALIYPLSTIGAHVSVCPNHLTGRSVPFETRGHIAMLGTFGYELDITKLSEEDLAMIPKQVAMYHESNDLVREGDYYRLASYAENHFADAYMVVSKDKSRALLTMVAVTYRINHRPFLVRLQGLDPNANYFIPEMERHFTGDALINAGIFIPNPWAGGDYRSFVWKIERED